MLLRASGNYREAKKALTRASNSPRATSPDTSTLAFTSDDMIYLAAYAVKKTIIKKKKKRCSDSTALKKLLGPGRYRVFWNRLRDSGQTLGQIARRYPIGVEAGS
jgi:hypothetical protein